MTTVIYVREPDGRSLAVTERAQYIPRIGETVLLPKVRTST
jgi:hypothetical protein